MSNIFNVAYYTFKDLLKSKVLFNVGLIGIALLLVSFVASELTFGVPQKVALDFGLGTLTISTVAIAILMGVGLISSEIENRTIFMVLSRPIERYEFLMGKVLGISLIFILNISLLSLLTLGIYLTLGGNEISFIFQCMGFIFFESLICLLVVLIFSLLTNKTLSIIFAISLYIAGHGVNSALINKFADNPFMHMLLSKYHYLFPGFAKINFKDFFVFGESIKTSILISGFLYSLFYSLALVFLACFILNKKNID